jgi:prevent-host-death family protein
VKEVPLSAIKDDLSRFLREAEKRDIVITRHGKPAGVLIGFQSEEDWFEYRLTNDPRFLPPDRECAREPARRARRACGGCRSGVRVRLRAKVPACLRHWSTGHECRPASLRARPS